MAPTIPRKNTNGKHQVPARRASLYIVPVDEISQRVVAWATPCEGRAIRRSWSAGIFPDRERAAGLNDFKAPDSIRILRKTLV